MTKERASQNVVHEGRFAAARDAGHAGQATKRKRDVDLLKIVFRRADEREPAIKIVDGRSARRGEWSRVDGSRFRALFRDRDARATGKISSR